MMEYIQAKADRVAILCKAKPRPTGNVLHYVPLRELNCKHVFKKSFIIRWNGIVDYDNLMARFGLFCFSEAYRI